MNEYDVKRLAAILSVQADIEGMKSLNMQRHQENWSMAYTDTHFHICAKQLQQLALVSNDNLLDFIQSL